MEPVSETPPAARKTTVQIGAWKLEGAAAIVALLSIIAIVIGLFWWRGLPRWPLSVSVVLWISFIAYWNAAAKNAAPTKSAESVASRQTHVRMMNGAFLLLIIPVLRGRFLPDALVVVVVGLAIQIAAGALGLWARRHLGRNWSGAITIAQDHQLVRTGPYRVLRHPIYTAMIGMFLGSAIAIGEWHALLGAVLIVIAYARKIPLEEASLRGVFGPAYDDYRKSSWGLIPGLY
jgi:protein-S-isoprenylcysteine O-methyltransferase Ste14